MNVQRRTYATSEVQDEIAAAIGDAATTQLIERLGGTRLFVPRTCGPHHAITGVIGTKAANLLARAFPSQWLDLPKPHVRRARALDAALAVRNGDSDMRIADVALAYDYTERWIYEMLRRHDEEVGAAVTQPDLFDPR